MKPGPPPDPAVHEALATGSFANVEGVQVVFLKGGAVPGLATQPSAYPEVSTGLVQIVVTHEPSVVDPTTQGSDGVAGWLLGPGGWLQLVVIQLGAPLELEPTTHEATGVDVLLAAGREQV